MPHAPFRVICTYYASTRYGSEYRAGMEFIKFAAANGFRLAIIADLEQNSTCLEIEEVAPGIRVHRISSPVKCQATLYRYTDVLPQTIWHIRTASWLRRQTQRVDVLWIQNGASPWLPLISYFNVAPLLVWGPVGGGEPPSFKMMQKLPWKVRLRERLRTSLENAMLRSKFKALRSPRAPIVIAIARTQEAQRPLQKGLNTEVPVIPEILDPIGAITLNRQPTSKPRFMWVGQDIPRKNLPLALRIFDFLRINAFPDATLDIFGCNPPKESLVDGVTFHGRVPNVDWKAYQNDGVLLLTSFREGLPSVVLEAVSNGLLCVCSDVGAISGLDVPTVFVLSSEEYPDFSDLTLQKVADRIRAHLCLTKLVLTSISYRTQLIQHLERHGILS